ncbi:hypothetical protein AAHE18_16G180200 [Arachis hypogaea]
MDTRIEVRRERESAWDSYMPCHFLDQVVKTLSRCLGLDPTTTQMTPITSQVLRRSPRPPLSLGRESQIHGTS